MPKTKALRDETKYRLLPPLDPDTYSGLKANIAINARTSQIARGTTATPPPLPQEPGDVFESHPYHFNPNFRLRNLATADPVSQGNQVRNDGQHAVIINEYGWHWVNRDGTPTTLTRDIYRSVLGENATAAQRFHMQATWLAASGRLERAAGGGGAEDARVGERSSGPDAERGRIWAK